jgi:centromeric protein E
MKGQIQKLEDEIEDKKRQMRVLEQRITGAGETIANNASPAETQQVLCFYYC